MLNCRNLQTSHRFSSLQLVSAAANLVILLRTVSCCLLLLLCCCLLLLGGCCCCLLLCNESLLLCWRESCQALLEQLVGECLAGYTWGNSLVNWHCSSLGWVNHHNCRIHMRRLQVYL